MPNSVVNFSSTIQIQDATGQANSVLLNRVFPTLQFSSVGQVVYSGYIQLAPTGGFLSSIFSGVVAQVLLVRNAGSIGFVDVQIFPQVGGNATITLAPGGIFVYFSPASSSDPNASLKSAGVLNDTALGILVEYLYAI